MLKRILLTIAVSIAALAQPGPYQVLHINDLMIPMRDCVRLATDIYLPARNGAAIAGKLPAIANRTPYNKSRNEAAARYFASHGYAVALQDVRGRFGSEGIWGWLGNDGPDGVDMLAWIAQQSWSNGKVGMFGTSYEGGTQHAIALERSPHLTTVIPTDAVSNMGYSGMRNGGAFEMRFWNWIHNWIAVGSRQARDSRTRAVLQETADNRKFYLAQLPLNPGTTPLKFAPEYEQWLMEAMRHGANDAFWKQNNIRDYPDLYKNIPVYLIGGWYDSWGGNTSANFAILSKQLRSPVYLIMGPWIHGQQGNYSHGQVSFGESAAIPDPLAWRKEWFDKYLKGESSSVGNAAPFSTPVRIFVMGTGDGHKTPDGKLFHGGSWRDEREWPLARARSTKFYLHAGGALSTAAPGEASSSTAYEYDPRHPVATVGGNISSGDTILLQGAWDQRGGPHVWNFTQPIPLSARRDVLVFQSEPLADDMEVTGEISVTLQASSSALDTDFTAKLIDVYGPSRDFPAGFDLNLEDGILRARFRESLREEKLMEPGRAYPMTIHMYPTSNVFKKGHRIRVDVSSSNFPRFDLNPNTGEPLGRHRRMVTAVNTVYHERSRASYITLPVVERR
ncbi:MAG: CocE/NonD family hydrolase [Bryobacteraceae bacterium]